MAQRKSARLEEARDGPKDVGDGMPDVRVSVAVHVRGVGTVRRRHELALAWGIRGENGRLKCLVTCKFLCAERQRTESCIRFHPAHAIRIELRWLAGAVRRGLASRVPSAPAQEDRTVGPGGVIPSSIILRSSISSRLK